MRRLVASLLVALAVGATATTQTPAMYFCPMHPHVRMHGSGPCPLCRMPLVPADALDARNMVADFGDIKRIVKGWVDREIDHRMILRHDDPLVQSLRALGEPVYLLDSNPTVERIAQLLFDVSRQQGLPVVRVTVWETPTSWATYAG